MTFFAEPQINSDSDRGAGSKLNFQFDQRICSRLPEGSKLPALLQTLAIIASPIEFLEDQARHYGDAFTLRVLGTNSPPVLFFSQPDALQAIFTTLSDKFELGKVTDIFRPLLGNESLVMQDGARHKQQRQMLMPALHGEGMYRWGQTICSVTEEITANWAIGETLNIQSWMLDISLEIILRVVFGLQPSARYQQLKHCLHQLLKDVNSPLYSVQFFLPPLQQNLGNWSPWGKFVQVRQQIDDLLYAEIADRRTTDFAAKTDILSMLLAARDVEGKPLSNVELRDQLMTLLLLGHETTASGLSWAFYWLHRHPELCDRLMTEIAPLNDPLTLSQQPYLTAVCKETLRIYPIALIAQPRRVKEAIDLMEYRLPPGAIVIPCVYLAHRRVEAYPQPEQFKPERFLSSKSPYEYLPFGGGNRSCIGMALALFEMKLVLATVLKNYRLALTNTSDRPPNPTRRGITFVPPAGFKLQVLERF